MVSHGNITANEQLIQKYFDFDQSSVVISWLPMFHDMGLIGALFAPLFVGFPAVLMAPNTFLQEPFKWLQAVTEFAGTTTGAPNFAYDLCVRKITSEQKRHLNLSSLKIAYNGAEPVRAETLERFSEAFAKCGFRPEACFPCYGMAETTLLVSGGPPLVATNVLSLDSETLERHRIAEATNAQRIVSCGQVGPDLEVRIVDPETGVECSPVEIGEIWVHGASIAQGYLHRPEETEATFQAKLAGDDRHWLRTGDYGFLRGGELYVTGRLKDLIIIRGRNIYPQDIERAVERALPFVEANSCAAFSLTDGGAEQLGLLIEANRELVRTAKASATDPAAAATLREHVARVRQEVGEEFEIPVHALAFVRPGEFPRTSSGKVQRHRCREMLHSGEHEFVFVADASRVSHDENRTTGTLAVSSRETQTGKSARPTAALRQPLHDTIVEWLRENVDASTDAIDDDTSFMALGIDSVGAAEIALQIEKTTGLSLNPDSFYDYRTLRELTACLEQRRHVEDESANVAEVLRIQSSPEDLTKSEPGLQTRGTSVTTASLQPSGAIPIEALRGSLWDFRSVDDGDLDQRTDSFHAWLNLRRQERVLPYQRVLMSPAAAQAQVAGSAGENPKWFLNFGSQDYLGLAQHPLIHAAAKAAIDEFGVHSAGSPAFAGRTRYVLEIQDRLAQAFGKPRCLIYPTGWAAGCGVIAGLARV